MARLAHAAFTMSILAGAAASVAATKTYVAPGSSTFSTAAAWSPSGAPTSADSIVLGNAITADSTITIDSGGVVAATTVDTTFTYTIALASGGPTVFKAGALNLASGSLAMAPGGSNTLRASSFTIANGARLNLNDNSAIFDLESPSFPAQETIRTALSAGRIAGATSPFNRIGYADPSYVLGGAASGTFAGQPVTAYSGTILLRPTLAGDTNLNGRVNFEDLLATVMNYNVPFTSGKVWSQGDFNYDGFVNFDDLLALAQNYNKTYPGLVASSFDAAFAADFALARSLVPEPCALAAMVLAAGVLGRRHRN